MFSKGPTTADRSPNVSFATVSTSAGSAIPRSTMEIASRQRACSILLPMKPGASLWTVTGTFPMLSTRRRVTPMTLSEVSSPFTTSTNGMSSGGFQK